MRITDDVRNMVVFFGLADDTPGLGGINCFGTGFFVGHEGSGYLVTARHLAHPLKDIPFLIRLNTKSGGSENLPVDSIEWVEHPDPSVDVAAIPLPIPKASKFNCLYYRSERFATSEVIERDGIGIGDLTYTVGLFRLMSGERRNLPIVHSGSIALMPGDEAIPVRDWTDPQERRTIFVNGYLVETHSISGLSGSPVFARATLELEMQNKKLADGDVWNGVLPRGRALLIGLWQSSWDAPPDEVMSAEMQRGGVRVPVGIGVVVPADKILEVLNLPEMKAQRDALNHKRRPAASLDGAVPVSSRVEIAPAVSSAAVAPDNPRHKEDFTALLNAAARKKP